jgi:hypothetical protein
MCRIVRDPRRDMLERRPLADSFDEPQTIWTFPEADEDDWGDDPYESPIRLRQPADR